MTPQKDSYRLLIENLPDAFDWISACGNIAQGGDAMRFEHYFEPPQRWYDVSA
jgi:hypothetical protein